MTFDGELDDCKRYWQAVESLMYMMIGTRPDLTFAVRKLFQLMARPIEALLATFGDSFGYLQGASTFVIQLSKLFSSSLHIGCFDPDDNGGLARRKLTSMYIFMNAGGATSWKARRRTMTAALKARAEYTSLRTATREAVWIR